MTLDSIHSIMQPMREPVAPRATSCLDAQWKEHGGPTSGGAGASGGKQQDSMYIHRVWTGQDLHSI